MTTTTNMNVMTQTEDMPEYISIYDRPKKTKGRPISKLTEEQTAQIYRDSSKRYYDKNKEQILIHKKTVNDLKRLSM